MSRTLRLTVARDTVRAELVCRGKTVWAAEARHAGPPDLCAVVSQLGADLPPASRPSRLRVELEPPLVQIRTLAGLPPVRSAALKRLVERQSARFFRHNCSSLVTDACWEPGGRRSGTARAAAVEESWATSLVSAAQGLALPLDRIGVAGAPALQRFDLLPRAERAARRRADLLSARRLCLVLAALWIAGGAALVARQRVEGARIERELRALREPMAAVARARREIGDATVMVETLARAERRRDATLSRLTLIGAAIPDSSYLTSVAVDSAGGFLSGRAREAARVVAALETSGAAPAPRLDGAVVRELAAGTEWERFTVRFGQEKK